MFTIQTKLYLSDYCLLLLFILQIKLPIILMRAAELILKVRLDWRRQMLSLSSPVRKEVLKVKKREERGGKSFVYLFVL